MVTLLILTYIQGYWDIWDIGIMGYSGMDEAQAGIRLLGKISITSDMQMIPPL